ncbi:relaxase/mobilization nuclease domain-containing protein [Nonomuraea typhae]|uniref:relaxase/mobilization nuclease domain-containing protein n=1 Tax=Nonomuraea typhae TaxID=2603600 RepID=UPI0012F7907C|nr:relaxase/mobilization nuclease domain-containing protein [Nonomuraea typhae]
MIGKIGRKGSRMIGLVSYLLGPGRANEHTDPHVIAADEALEQVGGPAFTGPGQKAALARELEGPRLIYPDVEVDGGHVWHCSLSLHPDEPPLTDETWADIARHVITGMGFDTGSGHAPCRWIAIRHGLSAGGSDHIHLAVNLIREDGTKASEWRSMKRLSALCADIERRHGLRVVDGRAGAGMPGLTRAEIEQTRRSARPEPDRVRLARLVRGCAAAARSEEEFVRRLRGAGVLAAPRYADGGPTAVVGFKVALTPAGERRTIWYGGGSLAQDLTLPRLRQRWSSTPQTRTAALATWEPGHQPTLQRPAPADHDRESQQFAESEWAQAAQIVAAVRDKLAAVALDDTAAWAGVAFEAAGVLAIWSARLETRNPGPLAAAADQLARAAQTRHGQPRAHRHHAVKDLRGVAMVAAHAATGHSPWGSGQLALLRQMTRLMQALHDAQLAHGRAGAAAQLTAVARDQLAALHTRPTSAGDTILHHAAATARAAQQHHNPVPER